MDLDFIRKFGEFSYGRPNIKVFDYTFANGCGVEVGKYTSIAEDCVVLLNHGMHFSECVSNFTFSVHKEFRSLCKPEHLVGYKCGDVIIGNDVWVGRNVTFMPGVTVGDGAVIGANSLVTKSVPPYGMVGSNPARLIKYRFSEEAISALLEIKWWDWPVLEVANNLSLIQSVPTTEVLDKLREVSHRLNN